MQTCSLEVWACVVPSSVTQHTTLLGRDSWMRFNSHSYRSLSPQASDRRLVIFLDLVHHASTDVPSYAIDPIASSGGFHLRYEGAPVVTLSDELQVLTVNFERRIRPPALTGHYLVDMVPRFVVPEAFPVSVVTGLPLESAVAPASPSPALLERITPCQRSSFLRV